ncbi:MAG: hypothetical protein WC227_04530 [Patescibacteria group bacterium]|jgi:hypothetical protein
MACLIAPAAVLIVTKSFEKKVPQGLHFEWLNLMLIGGTIMLLIDHIKNGEIVLYFPFFTAGYETIIKEIWHNGVPMTLMVIAAWLVMIAFAHFSNRNKFSTLSPNTNKH